MAKKDIFSETGNPNDTPLGNDFVDLDDPNGNQDFSDLEQNIAGDGFNQEPGNIDQGVAGTQNSLPGSQNEPRADYANFSDFDISDDDDLNANEFLTSEDLQALSSAAAPATQAPSNQQPENENQGADPNAQDLKFLETINKKYNKNFKTEQEFNDFLNKTNDAALEAENVVTDKEQEQYDSNKGNIEYLNSLIAMSDKDAIKEDRLIQFFRQNKRKPEAEDIADIDEQIARMEENSVLNLNADNVRNKYSQEKSKLENYNVKIDEKFNQAELSKQKQNQSKLLDNYKKIYVSQQGSFMGVKLSTKKLQSAFNDAKSGDFVKRILSDPSKLATLSLVEQNWKEIQKHLSQPGFSDGVQAVLNKSNSQGKRMGSNTRSSQPSSENKSKSKDEAFLM